MAGSTGPGGLEEWKAHWRVMLPCFAGVVLCSAHGHSLGVMIRPIEADLGWSRAEISSGLLMVSMIALFVAPLAGRAVDRIGARRIALFGVLFYCSSLALLSVAGPAVASWWALWVLLALANMTVMPVVWLAILNGYFVKSRGLAMAVALSGTGLGAAIFPMIANALVESVGWRGAYVALGALGVVAVYPLVLILFRPAPDPAAAAALAGGPSLAPAPRDPLGPQVRSMPFIKLAIASIVFAIASSALTTNLVPVLIEEGLTPAKAAATVGLLGLGSITGRLLGGFLLDRFNGNLVAAISCLLPLIPVAILLATQDSQLWAAAACVVMGLAIGAEVDCCAYLCSRHFGTRNFGTLFGTINGLLLFGNGLAPTLANASFDALRTYDFVLMALVPMFIVSALLFATLGRYPALEKVAPE